MEKPLIQLVVDALSLVEELDSIKINPTSPEPSSQAASENEAATCSGIDPRERLYYDSGRFLLPVPETLRCSRTPSRWGLAH